MSLAILEQKSRSKLHTRSSNIPLIMLDQDEIDGSHELFKDIVRTFQLEEASLVEGYKSIPHFEESVESQNEELYARFRELDRRRDLLLRQGKRARTGALGGSDCMAQWNSGEKKTGEASQEGSVFAFQQTQQTLRKLEQELILIKAKNERMDTFFDSIYEELAQRGRLQQVREGSSDQSDSERESLDRESEVAKRFERNRRKTEFFRQESCEEGIKQFINKLVTDSGKRNLLRKKTLFFKSAKDKKEESGEGDSESEPESELDRTQDSSLDLCFNFGDFLNELELKQFLKVSNADKQSLGRKLRTLEKIFKASSSQIEELLEEEGADSSRKSVAKADYSEVKKQVSKLLENNSRFSNLKNKNMIIRDFIQNRSQSTCLAASAMEPNLGVLYHKDTPHLAGRGANFRNLLHLSNSSKSHLDDEIRISVSSARKGKERARDSAKNLAKWSQLGKSKKGLYKQSSLSMLSKKKKSKHKIKLIRNIHNKIRFLQMGLKNLKKEEESTDQVKKKEGESPAEKQTDSPEKCEENANKIYSIEKSNKKVFKFFLESSMKLSPDLFGSKKLNNKKIKRIKKMLKKQRKLSNNPASLKDFLD